nr:MAG TPA: hypothetical protein [Caudoviricetes sp.]
MIFASCGASSVSRVMTGCRTLNIYALFLVVRQPARVHRAK